jgi:hypothetical protein
LISLSFGPQPSNAAKILILRGSSVQDPLSKGENPIRVDGIFLFPGLCFLNFSLAEWRELIGKWMWFSLF